MKACPSKKEHLSSFNRGQNSMFCVQRAERPSSSVNCSNRLAEKVLCLQQERTCPCGPTGRNPVFRASRRVRRDSVTCVYCMTKACDARVKFSASSAVTLFSVRDKRFYRLLGLYRVLRCSDFHRSKAIFCSFCSSLLPWSSLASASLPGSK